MSKKKPYKATSPIKHNGTRYGIDDILNLTDEEAEGLHVEPASEAEVECEAKTKVKEPDYTKGSESLDAKVAIKWIEDASEDALEGFVDPEKEDRVTVLRAWDGRFETNFAEDQE